MKQGLFTHEKAILLCCSWSSHVRELFNANNLSFGRTSCYSWSCGDVPNEVLWLHFISCCTMHDIMYVYVLMDLAILIKPYVILYAHLWWRIVRWECREVKKMSVECLTDSTVSIQEQTSHQTLPTFREDVVLVRKMVACHEWLLCSRTIWMFCSIGGRYKIPIFCRWSLYCWVHVRASCYCTASIFAQLQLSLGR